MLLKRINESLSWTRRVAEKNYVRGMQGREDNFAELKPKEY